MNVTATLIGQMLTFSVLVWFVMRFLWEPLTNMLEERKKRIADGLAAAERGQHEQALAEQRASERLHEAKEKAMDIINNAQKRADEIVDEAKIQAREEGERLLAGAQAEIEQEKHRAKQDLKQQVSSLALIAAEKILQKEIDLQTHQQMVDQVAEQLIVK